MDDVDEKMNQEDVTSRIFEVIKTYLQTKRARKGKVTDLEELLVNKGFESDDITSCINDYVDLNVLVLTNNKKFIQLVSNEDMEE